MKFKLIQFLALILATLFVASPMFARDGSKPLKEIAPDLVVESFDFGKFPVGHGPGDVPAEKVKFIPVKVVKKNKLGFSYGYRLKVKTPRPKILWRHKMRVEGRDHEIPISSGLYYKDWDIVSGYPKGRYEIRGWVEGIELPAISYRIK